MSIFFTSLTTRFFHLPNQCFNLLPTEITLLLGHLTNENNIRTMKPNLNPNNEIMNLTRIKYKQIKGHVAEIKFWKCGPCFHITTRQFCLYIEAGAVFLKPKPYNYRYTDVLTYWELGSRQLLYCVVVKFCTGFIDLSGLIRRGQQVIFGWTLLLYTICAKALI